jgi:hypothetical protein
VSPAAPRGYGFGAGNGCVDAGGDACVTVCGVRTRRDVS